MEIRENIHAVTVVQPTNPVLFSSWYGFDDDYAQQRMENGHYMLINEQETDTAKRVNFPKELFANSVPKE